MKIFKDEQEFIDYVAPIAQKVCKRYGFLPSILIAQTFHENGAAVPRNFDNDGIYDLMKYNCMVGQKAELLNETWSEYSVWDGRKFYKITPEEYNGKMTTIKDAFRIFNSVEESLADYILFLLYAKDSVNSTTYRYGASVVNIKDPEALITAVGKKYATGSSYAKNCMSIVRRYNLTKYDDLTNVKPTDIVPDILKQEKSTVSKSNVIKLTNRTIIDITDRNRNEVPRSRGSNPITYIVVHYLGVPNADNPDLYGGGYGGHYNIKRNGSVYKAANPRTAVVWHCGGGLQGSDGHAFFGKCTNYNSIGIECGVSADTTSKDLSGDSNLWYFTEETQESLVWLVSRLMDEYGISIDHVIRHYDVTGKICPNPYVKNNKRNTSWTWDEFKANLKQYRKDGTITIYSDTTAPTTTPTTKNYLSKGDSGEAVKTLQTMLNACGYNCGAVDGVFGSQTDSAVRAFQKANGLSADGYYGTKSKSKLEEMYKSLSSKVEDKTTAKVGTVYQGVDYSPVYNYTYYKKKYIDLRSALGNDKQKYFDHFCTFGMTEGRQGSSAFDVQKYKKRYEDLRKAFGETLPEYYKHYCIYGKKEGRKAV